MAGTGVTLAGGATDELAINSRRFLWFADDDVQSAHLRHTLAKFNVRSASRHVGGDCHGTRLSGVANDVRFCGILLSVE